MAESNGEIRTAFPALLATLQQRQEWLRELAAGLYSGAAPSRDAPAPSQWYEGEGARIAARFEDPELAAAWERVGQLQEQFDAVSRACVDALRGGDRAAAQAGLDRLFGLSSALTDLLARASIREISGAFQTYTRRFAERYEHDVLEAAQIARFSARLSDAAVVSCDAAFAALFDTTVEAIRNRDVPGLIGATAWRALTDGVAAGQTRRVAARLVRPRPMTLEIVAYLPSTGARGTLHGFALDVSQSEGVAEQRRLLSTAIEATDQVVLITNERQEIVYVNAAFTRITGYARAEVLGRTPRFLQGRETSQATRVSLREAIAQGRPAHAEILNYRKSGEPYWVEMSIVPVRGTDGALTHWIATERDITERKSQEQEITRLALEDHLTGLPNRRAAEARLAIEWNRARRDGVSFAVALADIDRFKLVNDQYGHQSGDRALAHVADLLARNLRGGDWVARWGGEEFLICFHDLDGRGALTAGERSRKLVRSRPLKLAQGELPLTVSIGVAVFQTETPSLDALLAQADSLLYEAKRGGRDKVLVAGKVQGRQGQLIWEGSQVQSALNDKRLVAAFQPIVDLRSGETVGEEALARIVTAERALVPAEQFVGAAEALHLIKAIDHAVSRQALARAARGNAKGRARFINLSGQFLADGAQVEALVREAEALNMLPAANGHEFVVELTERRTAELGSLRKQLAPLLEAGFALALDDFGSGSSSFMYLTDLPVSYLKIEGWMVQRIASDARIRQLVRTIVDTAQAFQLKTVAECVEQEQSAHVLRDLGVDWGQGFFFAEPVVSPSA